MANVFKLSGSRVSDLNIAGQVLFTVDLGELIEGPVRNVRDVEFVISNREQVIVDVLEDWIAKGPVDVV